MRRIDHWIGIPLARVIGWFTPQARSLYGDAHPEKLPERVICTKFIGLGSVVLSLPLLKALKDRGVKVAFWSFAGQAELAKVSGYVDEVWIIRPKLTTFLPTLWRSFRAARKFRAGAFLDLEPTANFTALLGRLSGAPIRIGFMSAKPAREALFTHLVALTAERHMVQHNLMMGQLIGLPEGAASALPAAPQVARSPLDSPQPAVRRLVVNINASDLSWHRMWPDAHWISLCKKLLEDPANELVFPGAPGEMARVGQLLARLREAVPEAAPRLINLAGRTSLTELMEVLRGSALVVSVDSGIAHIAAWVGTPVVGMFGPETPKLYAPHSTRAMVLWAGLACSPCLSVAADKITRCRDNQCMKRISPERALLACQQQLRISSAPVPAPAARPAA